jgi:peptide/nickel transport system substrate-binding protein
LRKEWVKVPDLETRQKATHTLKENVWNFVPHVYYGEWKTPIAHRRNVTGWNNCPGVVPFWNVHKT